VGKRIRFGHLFPGTWLKLWTTDKDRHGISPFLYLLVIMTLACNGGCKQCFELTHDIACGLNACFPQTPTDRCAAAPEEAERCVEKRCEAKKRLLHSKKCSFPRSFKCKAQPRSEPMVAYEPPRPPKFLLVPTRKVFSGVNMTAPTPRRGDMEIGFGPQIDFPGHD